MARASFHWQRVACMLAMAVCSLATAATPGATSTEVTAAQLQSEVTRAFRAEEPGAAVIVIRDGQVLLRTGVGMANLELGVAMTPDMIFRIGSVTKQFTAVAILMLMEQGKLSLSDEITRFLPDYPTHGQHITLEALLTHTAGIHSYTDMPQFWQQQRKDLTLTELIDFFKDQPLDFQPGTHWYYSNAGYVLLGAVIEKVSGQSYADFVEQRLFAPSAMTHSSFDRTTRLIANRVPGYRKTPAGFVNADYFSMTLPFSAGSLLSTVDDLAKWQTALVTGKLISDASLQRAWTSYHVTDGRATHYGYGWMNTTVEGLTMISHGGGINGFSCMVAFVPQSKVFVAVLTNREGGESNLTLKLAALASGRQWRDPALVSVTVAALERLVGTYRGPDHDAIVVTRSGDQLFADLAPYGKLTLSAVTDSHYVADANPLATFRFGDLRKHKAQSLTIQSWRGPDELATRVDRPFKESSP